MAEVLQPVARHADAHEQLLEALYDCSIDPEHVDRLLESLLEYLDHGTPSGRDAETLARHFTRSSALLARTPVDRQEQTLAQLPLPAIVLDGSGMVLTSNSAAEAMLGNLVRNCKSGRQIGGSSKATNDFRRAAAKLADSSMVALELAGSDGKSYPLRLLAVPGATDVLALAVPSTPPDRYLDLLQAGFELTAAEARLCVTLATGKTLEQIADAFCVSKNTLRTHLAAVFAKTGTHSQAELVARTLETIYTASAVSEQAAPRRAKGLIDADVEFCDVGGGRRIAYRSYGAASGVPVLYLHGYADAGLQRPEEAAIAADLDIRLLCPDRPGIGYSDPLEDPRPERYADDLLQLLDQLDAADARVIGHSMGAWDALALGVRLGPQLTRLALVSGALPRPPANLGLFERGSRAMVGTILNAPIICEPLLSLFVAMIRQRGVARFIQRAGNAAPCDLAALDLPNVIERIEAGIFLAERQSVAHTRLLMQLHHKPEIGARWMSYDQPLVLWHGSEDRVSPFQFLERTTRQLPGRSVHLVEGQGHRLYFFRAREILQDLLQTDNGSATPSIAAR